MSTTLPLTPKHRAPEGARLPTLPPRTERVALRCIQRRRTRPTWLLNMALVLVLPTLLEQARACLITITTTTITTLAMALTPPTTVTTTTITTLSR